MPPQATRLRGLPPITLTAFQSTLRELHQRAGEPSYREMSTRAHYSAATLCRVLSVPKQPSFTSTMGFVYGCRGDMDHWSLQYRQMHFALRHGPPITSFTIGPVAPPWPDSRVQSELLALVDRHMAVSLSSETLTRSLELVFDMLPPSDWTTLPRRLQWIVLETIRFLERASTPKRFASRMREARLFSGMTLSQISKRTAQPSIQRVTGRQKIAVSTLSNLCNPRHGRFPSEETLRAFLMAINAPEPMIEVWASVLFIATAHQNKDAETVIHVQEWIALASRYRTETTMFSASTTVGALGAAVRGTVTLRPPRSSP